MKIALVGTGRMGAAVEAVLGGGPHEIVARFNSRAPLPAGPGEGALDGVDVAVDFSRPELALDHIHAYCRHGVPAVIGTTGWYDRLDRVRGWVEEGGSGLVYAPNFSVGVAVVVRTLRRLAAYMDRIPEYDAAVHEVHHTGKLDSPSGTALALAETIVAGLSRKDGIETETQHGPIDPRALHVTSTRLGSVVGTHEVSFDSPFDRISLRHEAKSRAGFAFGAVRAAEWLQGRTGLFTLDDFVDDLLAERSGGAGERESGRREDGG